MVANFWFRVSFDLLDFYYVWAGRITYALGSFVDTEKSGVHDLQD